MQRLLITLAGICIYVTGYTQKVESLKKSSGSHNSGSGSKSGNSGYSSGSGNSGSGYSEVDPACVLDGCNALFNILSLIDFSNRSNSDTKSSTVSHIHRQAQVPDYMDAE